MDMNYKLLIAVMYNDIKKLQTEIEVSIGEIVDKLSILRLKLINITDTEKLKNVTKEYDYLYKIVFNDIKIETSDFDRMVSINKILWDVEDSIREKERNKEFDTDFIEMARCVYITNDQRAEIKKEIQAMMDELRTDLVQEIKLMRDEAQKQHEAQQKKIEDLNTWRWFVVGGAAVVGWLASKLISFELK